MKRLLLGLLWIYRRLISPVHHALVGPSCRFEPTCSVYAHEALATHGAYRGTLLTVRRLLRCQPFSRGGIDPVPPARGASR